MDVWIKPILIICNKFLLSRDRFNQYIRYIYIWWYL